MRWRLTKHLHGGWMIEYKESSLRSWKYVNQARHYQWEPDLPAVFVSKKEAATEMAKLIIKYS